MLRVSYDFEQLSRYLFQIGEESVPLVPRHHRGRLLVISRGFYREPLHRLLLAEYWLVSGVLMHLLKPIDGLDDNIEQPCRFGLLRGIIHLDGVALDRLALGLQRASQRRLASKIVSPLAERVLNELSFCPLRLWPPDHRGLPLLHELQWHMIRMS